MRRLHARYFRHYAAGKITLIDPNLPILMITGHGDVPMAVEAVKKGAWDFLQKPVNPEQFLSLIEKALAEREAYLEQKNGDTLSLIDT